jgi:hypothetical protein
MKRPVAVRTNEDNLRAARARLRAARTLLRQAATLLRQSVGLESMPDGTREAVAQSARRVDGWVSDVAYEAARVSSRITEAEAHLAAKVAARRRRAAA